MVHFCVMGGHEGELTPDQKICVTLFGGCELRRPTLAKRILEMRRNEHTSSGKRTHFFITICGATELKIPTLAEEYIAMRDAINSGAISLSEWDSAAARVAVYEASTYGSFTLMGGFSATELPAETEEIDGLALARHVGHIPDVAGKVLELGIGQGDGHRAAFVRQAFARSREALV